MRKYNWKNIIIQTVWVLAGIGMIVLLGAAMQSKNQKKCADVRIEITGVERHMFIDEKDVLDILNGAGPVAGNKLSAINLRVMEKVLERNPWVKNAEMFLDNNQLLEVRIEERQPVARVFTLEGHSFYLDSAAVRLPLSERISARVPVFTGFPSDRKVLARPDSALLHNILQLGKYIIADSFWMAQLAQINITPQANFELIPVLGDHLVALGNAEDLDGKFNRLFTFYRKAWLQNGINTYEKIDVQYNNQVVAVRKGTTKTLVDSARSREIMNILMAQAEAALKDSSLSAISGKEVPVKSIETATDNSIQATPIARPDVTSNNKTNSTGLTNNKAGIKPLSNEKKFTAADKKAKPIEKAKQPKAVMIKNR